ncbi:MAG: lysine--tRNA ligase [Mycoplasmoidaceae bacterium]|nr:lysine--tRNA ligase [Mycoplasmoidaceae bacterium]
MERKFNDQELARRAKLQKLIEMGKNPYAIEKFERTHNCQSFIAAYEKFSHEQLQTNNDVIKVAGRVMALRQTFGVISDFSGELQFYINKKTFDPNKFQIFKQLLDLGDIVGITGTPMKTMTGQVTIKVTDFVILAKSLIPLPEKFHGLADEEIRSRKRYLDLMTNRDSLNTFVMRTKIMRYIREYMSSQDFLEVETPILSPKLGGAAARPFVTHHNTLDRDYYLRIATELPLKKLIVGGFEKVYEIGRIFRNEGMDPMHNPEFTSIEAYQAYANLEDMMDLTENVIRYVAKKLGKEKLVYKNVDIDFSKPFKRISMIDMIKDVTKIDFNQVKTDQEAIALAKKDGIELLAHQKTRGHVISLFFEKYCEEKILQPTFVTQHPLDISPLAKKDPKDPRMVRRFELFVCQKEYANAFSDLNDPIDQLARFEAQIKEKEMGNAEANEVDMEYIDALEYGLAPTGGVGIGIDRLVMLLTGKESIRDVLLFPHLKDVK